MPVAVGILAEVTIRAMHADVEMDRGQVHGLLGIRRIEFFRIGVGDRVVVLVEQGAFAVALEYRAEIPAVAVIVGKLRVLQSRVEFRNVLQKFGIAPLPAHRSALGVAVEDAPPFCVRRVTLLLRPHRRRVGLVVPHRHAVETVDEYVRLVHVANHALRRRNRARELVLQRVTGAVLRDSRVRSDRFAFVAVFRVDPGAQRIAVVGVDHVAAGATGRAIVARLLVGAEEPHERIVQARLRDVDERHRNASACAGTAVGLLDIGTPRLLEQLQLAGAVRYPDFGKLAADNATAALEHTEDVARRNCFPRRQRIQLRQHALACKPIIRLDRIHDGGGLAGPRIGLAEHAVLERQYAVVVRRAVPQHCAGRHQAALRGLNHRQVAGPAGLARDPVVGRIDKPHERRIFTIQQRV